MENLRDKKLLILGGTRISCEIVKKAHEMGLFVAVTDYNKPENSPGKLLADESFMVSTTDVKEVVDLIKRKNIDGVLVGFNDMLLPYYADICEEAGLPCYGTKDQFELFTDKKRYKDLLRQYGVPTIAEYDDTIILDEKKREEIQYPVIVKPADNSGARGITICYDYKTLIDAYTLAKKESLNGEVIVEQYLDEREVTVFWIFQDGTYYVATIGNRHVKHNQEGVIPLPAGYSFPAIVTDKYLQKTAPITKQMFNAVGIKNGMMFMQCKVKDGQCLVYDIGYRLTGSLEYKMLKETCGYDPLEMMIYFALTGKMSETNIADKVNPYLGRYGYNISCLCAPGTIGKIVGREEVLKHPGVLDVVTAHQPGETITQEMKGLLSQVSVRVLGTSASKDALFHDIDWVQRKIHIISDDGSNLSLKGIEKSDLEGMLADVDTVFCQL